MAGRECFPPGNLCNQHAKFDSSVAHGHDHLFNTSSGPVLAGKVTLKSGDDPPPGIGFQSLSEQQCIRYEGLLFQPGCSPRMFQPKTGQCLDQAELRQSKAAPTAFSSEAQQQFNAIGQFQELAAWDANERTTAIQNRCYISPSESQPQYPSDNVSNKFRTVSDRDTRQKSEKHKHLKCPIPTCNNTKEFRGRWEVERHIKDLHHGYPAVGDPHLYRCAVSGCDHHDKVWRRLDKFRKHVRDRHPDLDTASHIQASIVVESVESKHGNVSTSIEKGKISTAAKATENLQHSAICGVCLVSGLACQCSHNCTTVASSEEEEEEIPVLFSPPSISPFPTGVNLGSNILRPGKLDDRDITLGTCAVSSDNRHAIDEGYPEVCKPFPVPNPISNQNWLSPSIRLNPAAYERCPKTFNAAVAPSCDQATDGLENGTSRLANANSSVLQAHLGVQSGSKYIAPSQKGKGREDGSSPDHPPQSLGSTPYPCLERYEKGFLCAFHNNPRQDKFRRHRGARKRFVCHLKRFHEMHGLFYCGNCLTPFRKRSQLNTHKPSRCKQYRCVNPRCVNFRKIVDTECPGHGRTNSKEHIYQWLQMLARQITDRMLLSRETSIATDASPNDAVMPSGSNFRSPRTQGEQSSARRSLRSRARLTAEVEDTRALRHLDGSHLVFEQTSTAFGSNEELRERIRDLEPLVNTLWQHILSNGSIDANLESWYSDQVPANLSAPGSNPAESYQERKLRSLHSVARQLWAELSGESQSCRRALRARVDTALRDYYSRRAQSNSKIEMESSQIDLEPAIPFSDDPSVAQQFAALQNFATGDDLLIDQTRPSTIPTPNPPPAPRGTPLEPPTAPTSDPISNDLVPVNFTPQVGIGTASATLENNTRYDVYLEGSYVDVVRNQYAFVPEASAQPPEGSLFVEMDVDEMFARYTNPGHATER